MSSVAPPASPPPSSDLAGRSSRREMLWFAVPIAAVFTLVGVFGIGALFGVGRSQCVPPTQEELKERQRFVTAYLTDAREFELEAVDCDDDGIGLVTFTTKESPSAARDAFTADGSCGAVAAPEGATSAAECESGRFKVSLLFGSGDKTTSGELIMEPA